MEHRSRGAKRPSFALALPSRDGRARGMPGAGRTHGPPAEKKQAAVTTGQPRHPGIPRAMVYGLYVLSPGTGLVCPRHRRIITTGLASASGGQDHTISLSAPCRSSAGESPLQHSPSIAFRCNVRDDRDTSPTQQRNGQSIRLISANRNRFFVLQKFLTACCEPGCARSRGKGRRHRAQPAAT